jgi:hypothetical protein
LTQKLLACLLVAVIIISGCCQQPEERVYEKPLKGVSLSPRSSGGEDFTNFFEEATQAGEIVMWAGDWNELSTQSGAPKVVTELSNQYNYIPLVEVTLHSTGELIRPLDEATKQDYKERAVSFAERYQPEYFVLGIEVNSIYGESPEDFQEFVALYNEIYFELKEVSPETKVFTVFQLEKMKGLALWSVDSHDPSNEQWWMIDEFNSDIVGFTTYPCLVHKDPSDIPGDYYTEIREHTSKPIAFTEMGWHSIASPQGWESSEAEQAEFIRRFFTLTEDLDPEIVVWSFMYDPDIIEPFNSMGLRRSDGTARLSWNAWLEGGRD